MQPAGSAPAKLEIWPRQFGPRVQTKVEIGMDILIRALITFVVVLLVLYLVNMLPIKGRAREIVRVLIIIIGVLSLLSFIVHF
jgi:hypothetical protein